MKGKNIDEKLTAVLHYIKNYITNYNYPPSVREIGAAINVRSTATVHYYLNKLQERGDITRTASQKRTVNIAGYRKVCEVPLVGLVRAGDLSPAEEVIDDSFSFSDGLFKGRDLFMLRVSGDSMAGAGVNDGDLAVLARRSKAENGEIVVAMHENNATVKRLIVKKDGTVVLHPENPNFEDIIVTNPKILGVLVGLIRRY